MPAGSSAPIPPANVRIVIGDTADTLRRVLAGREVEVFVHDSAHTYDHERLELELALEHSSPDIVLVSDNSHATTALADIAAKTEMSYSFFRERPIGHFYRGAGIGIATSGPKPSAG